MAMTCVQDFHEDASTPSASERFRNWHSVAKLLRNIAGPSAQRVESSYCQGHGGLEDASIQSAHGITYDEVCSYHPQDIGGTSVWLSNSAL
eukprot:1156739-Amphidinium_carterae.1